MNDPLITLEQLKETLTKCKSLITDCNTSVDELTVAISDALTEVWEVLCTAYVDEVYYYAYNDDPTAPPSKPTIPAIVGTAVVGVSEVGNVDTYWTTDSSPQTNGSYMWISRLMIRANGEREFTDPICVPNVNAT